MNQAGYEKLPYPIVVDSGAVDSALPVKCLPDVPLQETPGLRPYRGAGGQEIAIKGKKKVQAMTNEGQKRTMNWTVCAVRRPLISVSKMVEAGNKVMLEDTNPRVINSKTGQVTKLQKVNGVFTMDLWIKTGRNTVSERSGRRSESDFRRQAR